jgi:superfamily II DNA helicase RecQ
LYKEQFDAVVQSLSLKTDMLVLLRTGFGKSLIFSITGAVLNQEPGIKVLIITPLKNLSSDQRRRLKNANLGSIDITEDDVLNKDIDWCFSDANNDKPFRTQ